MRHKFLGGLLLSLSAATSSAALLGRAPVTPGGTDYQAYYDTASGLTWVANASLGKGTIYDFRDFYPNDGRMRWSDAQLWVESLNANDFLGASGWRLPSVTDTGTPGCNYSTNGTDCGYNVNPATGEMARLFYVTLGNLSSYDTAGSPQPGGGLTNTGPFANIGTSYSYWTGTTLATNTSYAWAFHFSVGYQGAELKTDTRYAWAVHSGDIAGEFGPVPLPPALWLFSGALGALIGLNRQIGRQAGRQPALRHTFSGKASRIRRH